MIIHLLRILPKPERRREVISILRGVCGPASSLEGCLSCESYDGVEEGDPVLHIETWESMATLQRYLSSPLYSRVLGAMELSARAPVTQIMEVSKMWGLELVESIKSQRGSG